MKQRCAAILLVLWGFLAGCGTSPKPHSLVVKDNQLTLPQHPFSLLDVPEPGDMFYLQDQQKQAFLDYYHATENQHVSGHRRLYEYLDTILDGFHFQGKTHNAATALTEQSGNCLSLAILTTALARLVDLEYDYQRVNSAPIYHRYHNVMTLSSHVRTIVYKPNFAVEDNVVVVRRPRLVIDYFPQSGDINGSKVQFDDFVAMYYQNLAGDALVKEAFPLAYSLLFKAWQIAPNNPETLNSLAVLYSKIGRNEDAERLYNFAMKNDMGTVNILSNYYLLLTEQGRTKEARLLDNGLQLINDDNPYRWLDIADRQYAKSNYSIALKYFKRAIQEAPYLHESYFGLAKVYYSLGLENEAISALHRALELAYVPEEQRLYQSKLSVLEASQIE